ncbi:MAG TPA: caspase family protein [Arenimonas sp.]|nr:caspase family protein [Arenimonas sp.]HPW33316.1 caspase family protein [Arenimonas sp.]
MSSHTLGSRFTIMASMAFLVIASALPVEPARAAVKNAEDLFIVDCLLPGQIRSLGRVATYMSARRPVRASQAECQIRGGEYVSYDRANYQTALKVWLDQANAGSAEAQNNVGEIYSKGLGTDPDYGMAYQWFKKAADQGFNRAKINLGYLYEEGLGVSKDTAMALNLYREASGIQDELLYSSVVEVEMKAKDDKIGTLQGQVESEKANSAELREQLKRTQDQLNNQRRALQQSQAQLQQTQSQLQQAKQQKDDELTKLLENQMLGQEQQINAQRQQIATLERRAGGAADNTLFAGGANFNILEPSLVATRGRNTAIVRGPGKRSIVGRVTSPKTIKQVTVNGVQTAVAANGTFNAEVDVAQAGTAVKVVALEQSGVRGELQFTMLPQASGSNTGATAASGSGGVGSLPRDVKLGRYFAVIIGNNTYRDAQYPSLKSAVSDATAVSNVLQKRYGYQTTLVLNASRLEMLTALSSMRDKMKPEDNLLVYYAGHGELSGNGATGYWVPTDGAANNAKSWISNAAISDILNTMPAKHIMVVADSCYSGSMTRAAVPNLAAASTPDKWNAYVKTMASGRSRTALTSGGVQPVPDTGSGNHSYFARAFLNVLQDNNRLMEAQRLYREVSTSLALNSINSPIPQNPQYAPIRYAGHESGDFFFMPKAGS